MIIVPYNGYLYNWFTYSYLYFNGTRMVPTRHASPPPAQLPRWIPHNDPTPGGEKLGRAGPTLESDERNFECDKIPGIRHQTLYFTMWHKTLKKRKTWMKLPTTSLSDPLRKSMTLQPVSCASSQARTRHNHHEEQAPLHQPLPEVRKPLPNRRSVHVGIGRTSESCGTTTGHKTHVMNWYSMLT